MTVVYYNVYIMFRWLKEQYMFLYYQDELYMGPLAVDAIKVIIQKYKNFYASRGNKMNQL